MARQKNLPLTIKYQEVGINDIQPAKGKKPQVRNQWVEF